MIQDLAQQQEADEKKAPPISYISNSLKEELVLEFVENFRKQYVQMTIGTRPPLILCPLNEFGVKKFVSTAIRPTELPYPDLYECDNCAKFVSSYVTYEPLEDPFNLVKKNLFFSPRSNFSIFFYSF